VLEVLIGAGADIEALEARSAAARRWTTQSGMASGKLPAGWSRAAREPDFGTPPRWA
jgi:hypothetical protein